MHLQKAKGCNRARNNFSVRLRCDVLAHRSTNSRLRNPQGAARAADGTIFAAPRRTALRSAHQHLEKKLRLAKRTPGPWGVGCRFAALQRENCAVRFLRLLDSYFRKEKLERNRTVTKILPYCTSSFTLLVIKTENLHIMICLNQRVIGKVWNVIKRSFTLSS